MADTVQLSEFRTRVRYKADIEVGASSSRFPDAELDQYINDACKQLYGKLVAARGEDYYRTTHKITCVLATNAYALPADFGWLVGVTAWDGVVGGRFCQTHPYALAEFPDLLSADTAGDIEELRYRLIGSAQIDIRPTPTSTAWNVWLHYVPAMTEMTLATDTFDGINGFEEWAVLTAAIACKTKDEEDPSALMAERAMVERLIDNLAAQRDAGRPATIQDTRKDYDPARWTSAGLRDSWDW